MLQREGSKSRYFYRFSDPIFQPYVILAGLSGRLISDADRRRFQKAEWAPDLTPGAFAGDPPPGLF